MLTNKTIGTKIAEARKKIILSQAELGERLFISPQAVGKWERGESMPDIATFNRLAEILGVDLNYFSDAASLPNSSRTSEERLSEYPGDSAPGPASRKNTWNMSEGNWADADFSGLKNLHEKFSSSNLLNCKFAGSDLSGLLLKGNNVNRCDFSGSDLTGSHIQKTNLASNQFNGCLLKDIRFTHSYIMGCDLSGANFTGAILKSGGFQSNLLADAIWSHTSFDAMHITDIVFQGMLADCSFETAHSKK